MANKPNGNAPLTPSQPTVSLGMTEEQWIEQVLGDINAPETTNNIDNLARWMAAENPPSDWYNRNNPLNTSYDAGDTSGLNAYTSLDVGATATAKTIEGSNMNGILSALQENAPTSTFATNVENSPWSTSHYADDPIANIPVPPLPGPYVGGSTQLSEGRGGVGPSSVFNSTVKLGTVGTVLQDLDTFLNYRKSNTNIVESAVDAGGIVSDIVTILDRGLVILMGAGLAYFGFKLMFGGAGSASPIQIIQTQQSNNRSKERNEIEQSRVERSKERNAIAAQSKAMTPYIEVERSKRNAVAQENAKKRHDIEQARLERSKERNAISQQKAAMIPHIESERTQRNLVNVKARRYVEMSRNKRSKERNAIARQKMDQGEGNKEK